MPLNMDGHDRIFQRPYHYIRLYHTPVVIRMIKRKDGLYQEAIQKDGKRKYFYGKSKGEVYAKIRAYQENGKNGLKFEEAASLYESQVLPKLTEGTVKVYRPALVRCLDQFQGEYISSITPKEISDFLARMKTTYSAKTIGNTYTVLNGVFQTAITNGTDIINPCSTALKPKSEIQPEERRPLTPTERAEILSTRPDEFLLAYLILHTGCRLGEACALQWSDIDFDANRIRITKAMHWRGNTPYIGRLKTKNGYRIVPLLTPLRDILSRQKRHREADFIVSGHNMLTMSQLESRWIKYCIDHHLAEAETKVWSTHGVPRNHLKWHCTVNRHMIRHDYATSLFRAGLDPKSVQHLLGHGDISTTMDIYVHWQESDVDHAARQIDQYFTSQ